jgi:hypothetical protein
MKWNRSRDFCHTLDVTGYSREMPLKFDGACARVKMVMSDLLENNSI